MPLVSISEVRDGVRLGLWRMEDNVAGFGEIYRNAAEKFKSEARRREFVCVRLLLKAMAGDAEILYEASGKPKLACGGHISISHTRGYCSVILSEEHEVAVDIEATGDRVCRIARKFMRDDETANDTNSLLVHWCAKETVYKLFSEDDLQFCEMRLLPAVIGTSGKVCMHQYRRGVDVCLDYVVTDEFVMAYASGV